MSELQIYLTSQLDFWRVVFGVVGGIMIIAFMLEMAEARLSWQSWIFTGVAVLLLALAVFLPSSDTVSKMCAYRRAQQETRP